jgi:casein kinase 1
LTEEFNKYLSYVRNLGFEDEPDYNYLRDLLTQALKNTGESEDGIYDWMKINDGKGWEAMKHHPTAAHLQHLPNSSQREIHGGKAARLPHDRLNDPLPGKPGAPRTPQALAARSGPQPTQPPTKPGQEEEKPTAWQRFMKIFCCGM